MEQGIKIFVADIINIYKPSIMAVVEPRVSGDTARRVLRKLRMPKFHIADPEDFADSVDVPWVVMGDFNDVANSSEKLGGQATSIGRSLSFYIYFI